MSLKRPVRTPHATSLVGTALSPVGVYLERSTPQRGADLRPYVVCTYYHDACEPYCGRAVPQGTVDWKSTGVDKTGEYTYKLI